MTTIDPKQTAQAADPTAIRAAMQFNPDDPRMGVEIEFHVTDNLNPRPLAPASDRRVRALKQALRENHGLLVDEEIASHMIEVKTGAHNLAGIHHLLAEIARAQAAVAVEAKKLDLTPLPTGNLPGLTARHALRKMITALPQDPARGARARTMMDGIRQQGMKGLAAYPLENVSAQVSIGARDPEHLFAMIRRHNFLLPFLMTIFHSRTPAFDAAGNKLAVHSGVAARQNIGPRGLIAPAFMRATDGEHFLRNYLEDVQRRTMIAYIDASGDFRAAARGERITLDSLREQGLATLANAQLSQSMDWHSAKVKTIPVSQYMRAELRDIDTGIHHAASMAIVSGLMNLDPECGRRIDSLLAGYGYAAAGMAHLNKMQEDMRNVGKQVHDGINRRFGDGFMHYFARDFYNTLEPYIEKYGLTADAAPLRHVCMTGRSEAMVLNDIIRTPVQG